MHLKQSRSRVYYPKCNPAFRDHSPYLIQVAYHLLYAECQYSLGNWEVARTYYSSALQLTGGENPRALYGITACTASLSGQRVRSCISKSAGGEAHKCSRWRRVCMCCARAQQLTSSLRSVQLHWPSAVQPSSAGAQGYHDEHAELGALAAQTLVRRYR